MLRKFTAMAKAGYRAPIFSPVGYLWRAALLILALLVVTALGFREHVSLISGTAAFNTFGVRLRIVLGCTYIVLYLAAVVLGPILVIAAGILWTLGVRVQASPAE